MVASRFFKNPTTAVAHGTIYFFGEEIKFLAPYAANILKALDLQEEQTGYIATLRLKISSLVDGSEGPSAIKNFTLGQAASELTTQSLKNFKFSLGARKFLDACKAQTIEDVLRITHEQLQNIEFNIVVEIKRRLQEVGIKFSNPV